MSFTESITTVFGKITVFDGRASRPEFWWWYLFVIIVNVAVSLLETLIGTRGSMGLGIIGFIVSIVFLIASLSVGCRRLHDTGKSGWLQLLLLIPCIGFIVLVIFWVQPGQASDNAYGAPPAG